MSGYVWSHPRTGRVALLVLLSACVVGLLLLALLFRSATVAAAPAFDCRSVTEIPRIECRALVALYNSTNGPGWLQRGGWLVTTTPCLWYGVICDAGYVVGLKLQDNRLDGYFPLSVLDLRHLGGLGLYNNQLRGPVPPQIGYMPYLQGLSLSGNPLSGPLPESLMASHIIALGFDRTSLCEPASPAFQSWLAHLKQVERTGVLCPLATPTPTCTMSSLPSPYAVRLNAGGPAHTDTLGLTWDADRNYAYCTAPYWGATGGQVYTTTHAIAGTDDQALYQSEHYFAGPAGYRVAVPNGQYTVTLRFAEIYPYAYAGSRVFDVRAEGQAIVSNLDVLARSGGLNRAYDITATVTVSDGELNLDFVPHPGHNAPFVNAIAVTQLAGSPPTATPTATPPSD
jgi:hypothetical protein